MYTLGQAWHEFLAHAFDFKSKVPRSAYWWVMLIDIVIQLLFAVGIFVISFATVSLFFTPGQNVNTLSWLQVLLPGLWVVFYVIMWIPITALTTRRLIDVGLQPTFATVMTIVSGLLGLISVLLMVIPEFVPVLGLSFIFNPLYIVITSGTWFWVRCGVQLILGLAIFVLSVTPSNRLQLDE